MSVAVASVCSGAQWDEELRVLRRKLEDEAAEAAKQAEETAREQLLDRERQVCLKQTMSFRVEHVLTIGTVGARKMPGDNGQGSCRIRVKIVRFGAKTTTSSLAWSWTTPVCNATDLWLHTRNLRRLWCSTRTTQHS